MSSKPRVRFHVEDNLARNSGIQLNKARSHHLGNVLRLRAGAPVALFNGRDGEWLARIDSILAGRATLTAERRLREQSAAPDLWLVFAPLKKTPLDFLVQKATELGVSALMPAITRRTVVKRVKRERMLANTVEAAEQCERLCVPRVDGVMPLPRILDDWPDGRHILLCAEYGEAEPIWQVLGRSAPARPCAILTGPEGGFEQSELDALRNLPFVTTVGLGPRILRADTAALTALACWQAVLGDWRNRPPGRA